MKNKVISLFGNNKIVQNKGVKYSELLEQFMSPFVNEFKNIEYIEDIIEFAISAWNFGNIEIILPKGAFKKATKLIKEKEISSVLLRKMIDYKVSNFKEYENFIVDYEIKDVKPGENPVLSIVTQEKEVYLANMLNEKEKKDLHTQENYEENYINRSAIILKIKQPFFDWYADLYPEDDLQEASQKANIYLIDETIDDLEKWLKKKFDKFFKMELSEWSNNKKEWPKRRDYKMFNLWFRVEISEDIYDLEKKPILKQE